MENTQRMYIKSIAFLVIGLVIGWLVWGRRVHTEEMNMQGHDMSAMMMDMNAGLQGKTGDDFDKGFLAEMIMHHQGAIDMAQLAQANAKHQEIKDLAGNIITAQTKEIAQMKDWQKNWYNQ